jgi:3-deoxy-D-manno-octulosonic-acid transferase
MFQILYNLLLGIYLLIIFPKLFYQRIRYGKYKKILSQKLGFWQIPKIFKSNKNILWIHAVSLGEVKVGLTFLKELKHTFQNSYVIFTTITNTGMQELKKSEIVDNSFYLPFDFSWILKKLLKKIKPDFVFLVESDFWLNFLKEAKKYAKIFLINGKISHKSAERFKFLKPFSNKIFENIDFLCVQNEEYFKRFEELGIKKTKLAITGNMKFDFATTTLNNLDVFKERYRLSKTDKILTIASTHDPEERLILNAIMPFLADWKVLLAPRHPERMEAVSRLIKHDNVVLIKEMGLLPVCFSLSELAIIGGSFSDNIGGHNIIEPCLYNIPVIFGPYMSSQKDLVKLAMKYQLGYQTTINGIPQKILEITSDKFSKVEFKDNLKQLKKDIFGSTEKTINTLFLH